ncbi:MAG: DNA polymerase III subunit epsilon [Pseudomonadales bacterium]
MRQIVLDTETTGLEPRAGHRIIEIGAVEIEKRRLTGSHYHQYINPEREIDEGAQEVHGISLESLQDKPLFAGIAEEFIEFVRGAELVIHNAPFDIGFLDNELALLGHSVRIKDICTVVDSLVLARQKHPGQKNNLDALCKRYDVDNSQRDLHGALLDAEILADLYLVMTGGQTRLSLTADGENDQQGNGVVREHIKIKGRQPGRIIAATAAEIQAHEARLAAIDEMSGGALVWPK